MVNIKKTYREISPDLLYAEVMDFSLKQGLKLGINRQETYTLPDHSADFILRGTLTFTLDNKECLRVHIVGTAREETKLMMDVDETIFPPDKLAALQADLDFIFSSKEED